MADVDELNDAGSADGDKDLVADFLMREQDKLAGLEDDFGMGSNLFTGVCKLRSAKMRGGKLRG